LFYISKITPFFFILGIIDLLVGIFLKITHHDYIYYGLVFVFGFIASIIIGAMYQIIPNSQQEKLPYEYFSYINFSFAFLTSLFLILQNYKIASLVFFLLTVFFSIHMSLIVRNVKPITVRFLIASLFYMVLSSAVFLASSYGEISKQAAIHTFTIGTMINAVFGVEFAWIPMFYMQTADFKKGNIVFILNQLITIFALISFGFFSYNMILPVVLSEIAVSLLFISLMISTIKKGKSLIGIPYTVKFFLAGLFFLVGGLVIAMFITILKNPMLIDLHVSFMVLGFGVFTITGGMLHLTPRILWNMVYIKKAQQGKQVPQVNMVIPKNKAETFFRLLMICFIAGIFLEGIGFLYGWTAYFITLIGYYLYFSFKLFKFLV